MTRRLTRSGCAGTCARSAHRCTARSRPLGARGWVRLRSRRAPQQRSARRTTRRSACTSSQPDPPCSARVSWRPRSKLLGPYSRGEREDKECWGGRWRLKWGQGEGMLRGSHLHGILGHDLEVLWRDLVAHSQR
eukprot:2706558-Rhodomonas_salina.2